MLRTRRAPTFAVAGLVVAAAAVVACAPASGSAESPHGQDASAGGPRASAAEAPGMEALRRDMARYEDPAAAVAAGWVPTEFCVESPSGGGDMGLHYVNPALQSRPVDPAQPSILVYVPTESGPRLGAVEWFQADADQDLATTDDRPSLFGVPFDGPMPGHEPGMPVHYDLHAWLFETNPDGMFAPWNPQVRC